MIPEAFLQGMAEAQLGRLEDMEDMEDICAAREVLATETEWTPWAQVKAEIAHEA